jgi:tetratricopeptide (TPR) repeat protein
VSAVLAERFARPVVAAGDPELAIAHGAALIAAERCRTPPHERKRRPDRTKGAIGGWTSVEVAHVDGTFLEAAYLLGELLWERERPADAEHWFRLAANANHVRAAYQLGWIHKHRNEAEEARAWWERAARGGDVDAAYHLGELLWERQEPERAEAWFLQSASEVAQASRRHEGSSLVLRARGPGGRFRRRRSAAAARR